MQLRISSSIVVTALFTLFFPALLWALGQATPAPMPAPPEMNPEPRSIETYKRRYQLDDVYEKAVDNRGKGMANLYGVRNFRVVLHGVAYRGGANNVYLTPPRDNMNPLPPIGLKNICGEGIGTAIYLYSTNFATADKQTLCTDFEQNSNQLNYVHLNPQSTSSMKQILAEIYKVIMTPSAGPIYMHCWNGWHASGLASALALRQFCGLTGQQAVAYWDKNTDGNNKDSTYESHRQRIRNFTPYAEFKISDEAKREICPQF